jgi:hypothetical protein
MPNNNQILQILYTALLFAFIFLLWTNRLDWLWMLGIVALGGLGLFSLRKRLSPTQMIATAAIFSIGILGYCWLSSAARR